MRAGIICAFILIFPLFVGCTLVKETPKKDFEWQIKDGKAVIIKYKGESPNVVIPGKIKRLPVTEIGEGAFRGCGLTRVVLPQGVRIIGESAFSDNKLESLTLPKNIDIIETEAFKGNSLTSITIPEKVTKIGIYSFAENPLREVIIKSNMLLYTSWLDFHSELSIFRSPGKYIFGDDGKWVMLEPDLSNKVIDAIKSKNTNSLKNCIALGADVKSRIFDDRTRRKNTPLAAAFYAERWPYSGYNPSFPRLPDHFNSEIVKILLDAGAVPQYWMLTLSYLQPDITKMLLEYGVLSNSESPEYGFPPTFYKRPASLIFHYVSQMRSDERAGDRFVLESVNLLLEYGETANYRDPNTGATALSIVLRMYSFSPEMAEFLLKHASRPLSLEEYRLLIELSKKIYSSTWWYDRIRDDEYMEEEDKWSYDATYDAVVLEDIRKGILNSEIKDADGKDIFYYAATLGTTELMKGLMPYIVKSGRTILAPDRTGLFADAVNAGNLDTAAVLYTAVKPVFSAEDARGREYSLEFYNYDYIPIYLSAQRIKERSLHQTGRGGTRLIDGQEEVRYSPNAFYVFNANNIREDLILQTTEGASFNLDEIINEAREQHYSKTGREKPNEFNPRWHIARIFGKVLYAYNRVWWDEANSEYALVDISAGKPSVYILETDNLKIGSMTALYEPHTWISLLDDAMDFVIDSEKAYLIKNSGEVLQFAVREHSLQFEKTASWRDCRIPGWKDGERVFVNGDTVEVYNFSTGTARPLGKKVEIPHLHIEGRNYLYEDKAGRRFVVEAKSGRAYPEPEEEFHNFALFEKGYIYVDKDGHFYTVCIFEDGVLKRKLVLSGSAMGDFSFSIYGDKIYIGSYLLAFTIDIKTAQVSSAFNSSYSYRNAEIYVYMFPFADDDIVYTYTIDYGK